MEPRREFRLRKAQALSYYARQGRRRLAAGQNRRGIGVAEISLRVDRIERYYRLTCHATKAILSPVKTIILTLSAAKDLDALPRDAREQVEAGLHRYAMTGQGDVKALQGRDGYRLRIGGYRVIFDEDATTILAIYIGRRATTTYKRN